MRRVASSVAKTVVKPFAKKALQSGISHAGDELGKKTTAEKIGDFIMKKRAGKFNTPSMGTKPTHSIRQQEESTDMAINRLISGTGIKRMRGKIV